MKQDFFWKTKKNRAKDGRWRRIVPAFFVLALMIGTAAASAYEPWDALPGLAALLAAFCLARMAERPMAFAVRCLVLALMLASVALIKCLVPQEAAVGSWWTALRTLWHGLSAAVLVLGLRLLVPWEKCSLALFSAAYATVTAAALFFWGYFLAAGRWASGDTFVAIEQTNPSEAAAYWGGHMGVSGTLAVLLLITATAWLGRWLARVQVRATLLRPRRLLGCFLLALSLVPFVFLCAPHSGSYYGRIGSEGFYAVDALRAFRAHHAQHADELAHAEKILPGSGGIHVLVIGESQNKQYMHAYGHDAATTPWLDAMKASDACVFFEHAYSNHVYTVPALTYALTEKNQYNTIDEADALSILEVAKAAGYRTAWISNQGKNGISDTPMSVISSDADIVRFLNEHQYLDLKHKDGELVPVLDDVLDELAASDTTDAFIVVHLMGCHELYSDRYPENYDGAVCDASTSEGKYENAIRYNDDVVRQIYDHAKTAAGFRDLIYFSDHGEAPASGHGHDPTLYEPCMTYIPFYILFSDAGCAARPEAYAALRANARKPWTNDLAYEVLVTLLGITPPHAIEQSNNIASSNYDGDLARLRTCHGEREITPEE